MPSRYIQHSHSPPEDSLDAVKQNIGSTLSLNLERVHQNTVTRSRTTRSISGTGVYVGIAGITLMASRVSSLKVAQPPALVSAGDRALVSSVKRSMMEGSLGVRPPGRASFLETDVGVLTLMLLRIIQGSSSILVSDIDWKRCVRLLQGVIDQIVSTHYNTDHGCEVLYGRAGFLYALLLMRNALPPREDSPGSTRLPAQFVESLEHLTSDDNIRAVVEAIIDIGRVGAREYVADISGSGLNAPPLMWVWHGRQYLGAAHGVAGILQMLWSCPSHIVFPYMSDMLGTLMWLVGLQDKSGNWPTKAPKVRGDLEIAHELVQWCHGAPGIMILLSTTIRRSLSPQELPMGHDLQEKVIQSLRLAGRLVYRHGLLRKGVGICHGVAGSIFSLLAVSDIIDHHSRNPKQPGRTSNKKYLLRAVHLAHLAASHETLTANGDMSTPDRPWSLYEGIAGMCCAWGEVLLRLEGDRSLYKSMPGYDDLHKPLAL